MTCWNLDTMIWNNCLVDLYSTWTVKVKKTWPSSQTFLQPISSLWTVSWRRRKPAVCAGRVGLVKSGVVAQLSPPRVPRVRQQEVATMPRTTVTAPWTLHQPIVTATTTVLIVLLVTVTASQWMRCRIVIFKIIRRARRWGHCAEKS